jgi:type IV secretory pathway TrbD component
VSKTNIAWRCHGRPAHRSVGHAHLLKGPDREVHVIHVSAAPALVARVVVGVVAGAGISHHHHNRRILVVAFTAFQPLAVAVVEGCILALDFLALAAASRIVAGNVPAGGYPAGGGLVRGSEWIA